MQSERIESQKRAKTVSRLNLALYLLCMLSFTGCMSSMSKESELRMNSFFANPPSWIAVEDFKNGPAEAYILEKENGVYRMTYQTYSPTDLKGSENYYPVMISGTPFAQETDDEDLLIENQTHYKYGFETTFDKWTITLIDPNIEPISSQRPNGDYWKINDVGMLEIWRSGAVVETIPNLWLVFIMEMHAERDEFAETHGGKWYYIDGSGEILQPQQCMDQWLSGMSTSTNSLSKVGFPFVWECAEGHRWDAHRKDVCKNNWCPTCFDIETGTE